MILKVTRFLILNFSLFILASCGIENGNSQMKKIAPQKLLPVKETAVNDSLVSEFANQLEIIMNEGLEKEFTANFDMKRFNERVTFTSHSDDKIEKYRAGFLEGFGSNFQTLPTKISQQVELDGFYDFINYYYNRDTKSYHVLFRLFSENDGINYHDYELVKRKGRFLIQDLFIYVSGENISATMNRLFLLSLPKNLFEKLILRNDSKNLQYFFEAIKSHNNLEFAEAHDQLNKITGKIRKDRFFHVLQILVSVNLTDEHYLKALEGMRKEFPDDPTCALLSLDYYLMKEDFENSMKTLDQLEEQTNDTFLNYQRGNIAFSFEEYTLAVKYFEELLEEYPYYETAKTSLLSSYVSIEDFEQSVELLDNLLIESNYSVDELIQYVELEEEDGSNILAPLMKSKSYQNWKKRVQ